MHAASNVIRRETTVPAKVTVNWDDHGANRGRTHFELIVGVHITPETFLKHNDRGQLWVTVEHWHGGGPPDLDKPFLPSWHFDHSGGTAGDYSSKSPLWMKPDVHWPTLEDAAKGKSVRWPGCDELPKRQ